MKLTTKVLKKLIREELSKVVEESQFLPESFDRAFPNALEFQAREFGVTPDMYEILPSKNPDYVSIRMPQLPPSSPEVQAMKKLFKDLGSKSVQVSGVFEKGAQNMQDMPTGSTVQVYVADLRKDPRPMLQKSY